MHRTAIALAIVAMSLSACGGNAAKPPEAGNAICTRGWARVLDASGINDAAERIDVAISVCDTLADFEAAAAASPRAIPVSDAPNPVAWLAGYCGRAAPKVAAYALCKAAIAAK